jgi:hypothetical protein
LLDDQLYYRTIDGVLPKCLNQEESKVLMDEIHEGVCDAHQPAYKMKWIALNITKDARTVKGLATFRKLQHRL